MATPDYGDLLSAASPLTAAGIDPDDARLDPTGALKRMAAANPYVMAAALGPSPAAANSTPVPRSLAAPQSAGTVPASVSPTGATSSATTVPSSMAEYGAQIVRGGLDSLNRAGQADQEIANLGTEDQAVAPLEQQRVAAAAPIDPRQAQYKPAISQKIMRGVGGFLRGGIAGAIDPTIAKMPGYRAPNAQYGIDAQMQTGKVASLDQQIAGARADWKGRLDAIKARAAEERAQATTTRDVGSAFDSVQKGLQPGTPEAQAYQALVAKGVAPQDALGQVQGTMHPQKDATLPQQLLDAESKGDVPGAQRIRQVLRETNPRLVFQEGGGHSLARPSTGGGGGAASAPSEASGTGDDYLNSLPANMRATVKATANGDIAMPGASSRNKDAQALRSAVLNYDPSYTDARYKSKQLFKTGGDAANLSSGATALGHLLAAKQHSVEAGTAPLLGMNLTDSSTAYNKAMDNFVGESGKMITGKALTQGEFDQSHKGYNSPIQHIRDKALDTMAELMTSKVKAQMQKYKNATGQEMDADEFFDKPTQDTLEHYGVVLHHGHTGGANPTAKAGGGGFDWDKEAH